MIIEFEGRTWDVDPAKINVDEWREFKRKYKMTPAQFEEGIKEADPDASTFLYWIMLRRSGQQMVSLGDHLKPDIIALNEAVAKVQEEEAKRAPEPEPEPPVPPTSRPGSEASPVPGSQTTTTPPATAPPALTLNGSGQVTSNSSMPSISAPSPPSATSTSQMSASSP